MRFASALTEKSCCSSAAAAIRCHCSFDKTGETENANVLQCNSLESLSLCQVKRAEDS